MADEFVGHVGFATLSVIPSLKGIEDQVSRQIAGPMQRVGAQAGRSIGGGLRPALLGAGAAASALSLGLFDVGKHFDAAFDTIRVGTGATGAAFKALKGDFNAVFRDVPASTTEVATAITGLNRGLGLTGKALQERSEQIIELSRITKTDLTENIHAVTGAFNNWNIPIEQQGPLLDELFRIYQKTGTSVGTLAEGVASSGALFRQAGFSFEESAALLALFDKAGVDTSKTSVALSKAIAQAAKEGKSASQVFQETFAAIKNAPSDTAAAAAAVALFGTRAGPQLAGLIRQGKLSYDDLVASIQSGGDTIKQATKETDSFTQHWQILLNRALVKIEPVANAVFQVADKLVVGFITPAGQAVQSAEALVFGFGKLGAGVRFLRDKLGDGLSVLKGWVLHSHTSAAAAAALAAADAQAAAATATLAAAQDAAVVGTASLAAAQEAEQASLAAIAAQTGIIVGEYHAEGAAAAGASVSIDTLLAGTTLLTTADAAALGATEALTVSLEAEAGAASLGSRFLGFFKGNLVGLGAAAVAASIGIGILAARNAKFASEGQSAAQSFLGAVNNDTAAIRTRISELQRQLDAFRKSHGFSFGIGNFLWTPGDQAQAKKMQSQINTLKDKLKENADAASESAAANKILGGSATDAAGGVNTLSDALGSADDAMGPLGMKQKDFEQWAQKVTPGLNFVAGSLQDLAQNSGQASRGVGFITDALQKLSGEAHVSGHDVRAAFDAQLTAFDTYQRNITTLVNRHIPDALLKQLTDMGTQGAGVVAALASANKTDFDKIVGDWTKAGTSAGTTSADIIKAFDDQLRVMGNYQSNFDTLIARHAPDSLLQQLAEMGQQGAGLVDALAHANASDFAKIIRDWNNAGNAAPGAINHIQDAFSNKHVGPIPVWFQFPETFDIPRYHANPDGSFSAPPGTTVVGHHPSADVGGWIMGPKGAPVEYTMHGKEYVLSNAMVDTLGPKVMGMFEQFRANPTGSVGERLASAVGALASPPSNESRPSAYGAAPLAAVFDDELSGRSGGSWRQPVVINVTQNFPEPEPLSVALPRAHRRIAAELRR